MLTSIGYPCMLAPVTPRPLADPPNGGSELPVPGYPLKQVDGFPLGFRSRIAGRWSMQDGEEEIWNAAELNSESERQALAHAEHTAASRGRRHQPHAISDPGLRTPEPDRRRSRPVSRRLPPQLLACRGYR